MQITLQDTVNPSVIILDSQGRPLNLAAAKAPKIDKKGLTEELGTGGVSFTSGIIDSDEFNDKLTGQEGVRTYDKMRRTDAKVAGLLNAVLMPCLGATYDIELPDEDDPAFARTTEEHVQFLRENLFQRLDFTTEFLRHALSCIWSGYSWFEKVYVPENSKLYLSKLSPRIASTVLKWNTTGSGELETITQETWKDGAVQKIEIPRSKIALFTFQREANDYEGTSLLRPVYRHWLIKDTLYKLDAIRNERYAVGVPHIKLPADYSAEMLTMAKAIGKNWKGAEQSYVVSVEGMEINILQVQGGESLDLIPTIKHHDEMIPMVGLAQFLSYGTTETGSRALGESSQAFFYDALRGWLDDLMDQANREVCWPLLDLNYPNQPRPRLGYSELGSASLSAVIDGLQRIGEVFITPTRDIENDLRDRFNLPPLLDEEEFNPPKSKAVAPAPGFLPGAPPAKPEEPTPKPAKPPVGEGTDEPPEPPAGEAAQATSGCGHVHLQATPSEQVVNEEGWWRPLRPVERHIALRQIEGAMIDAKDQLIRVLLAYRKEWVKSLVEQVQVAAADGPLAINKVAITKADEKEAVAAFLPILLGIYEFGQEQVRKELESQAREAGVKLVRNKLREKTIVLKQAAMWFRDEGLTPTEAEQLINARAVLSIKRLREKTEGIARSYANSAWRTQGSIDQAELEKLNDDLLMFAENESRLVAAVNVSESMNLGRDAEAQKLKESIQFADYSAIMDNSTCFPAGERVKTKSGWVPIENVHVGDRVLTHKGRYRRVVAVSNHRHTGTMARLATPANSVVSTDDHRYLTPVGWTEAKDLQEGRSVQMLRQQLPQCLGHVVGNVSVEGSVGNAEHLESSTPDKGIAEAILGLDTLVPKPTVDLHGKVYGTQHEIHRVAANLDFLVEGDSHGHQAEADVMLGLSLPTVPPVATERAEFSGASSGGRCPELFAASQADDHCGRTAADFRAMLPTRPQLDSLPASRALSPDYIDSPAKSGASDIPRSIANRNSKGFSADRTSLSHASGDFAAGSSAISRSRTAALNPKRLSAYCTGSTVTRSPLLPFGHEAMGASVVPIARHGAIPVPPPTKLFSANRTRLFHVLNISKKTEYTTLGTKVFDLTVEEDHSFIVEGFVVHNCENCESADGQETELDTEEYYDISPPLNSREYGACLGGANCRCIFAYVLKPPGEGE